MTTQRVLKLSHPNIMKYS